jgi:hypothetical protein
VARGCQPDVAAAINAQISKVGYLFSGGGYSEASTEELADLLLNDQPGGLSKAIFLGSGSEATDATIKLITQYWHAQGQPQCRKFIARKQSYHGNILGALSVSGHQSRRDMFSDFMSRKVSFVDPCYAYRCKTVSELDEEYVQRLRQQLDDEFQALDPDTVAAFFAETIAGLILACVPAVPGYFQAVREVCDKYGAILVLDEVRTISKAIFHRTTDASLQVMCGMSGAALSMPGNRKASAVQICKQSASLWVVASSPYQQFSSIKRSSTPLQPNLEFWLEGILSKLILLHVQLVLQPKRLSKGITY